MNFLGGVSSEDSLAKLELVFDGVIARLLSVGVKGIGGLIEVEFVTSINAT